MKLIAEITLVLIAFLQLLHAEEKVQPTSALMHSFYSKFQELRPYVSSEEAFSNKKNKEAIGKILKQLSTLASESSSPELNQGVGFNYTYSKLAQQLRETSNYFERDIYSASLSRYKSSLNFCISCHDRLPKKTSYSSIKMEALEKMNSEALKPKVDNLVNTTFEEGEFFYIAHDFEKALAIFNSKIRGFKKDDELDVLQKVLLRKLTFFVRVEANPTEAAISFSEDLKNTKLPIEIRTSLKSWVKEFNQWNEDLKLRKKPKTVRQQIAEASQFIDSNAAGTQVNLGYPLLIPLLKFSGTLYELAYRVKTPQEKVVILFLLAKYERELVSIHGYSLSDVYLQACVETFPKSTVAQRCFADYELSMKQKSSSGNSEYLKSSVEILRKKLNASKKVDR